VIELARPINVLVSFHYFKSHDLSRYAREEMRIVGDSGAFSAESLGAALDIDEFGTWATKWRNALVWAASLDVIGDAKATWSNYTYLRKQYDLEFVPTLH